MATLTVRAMSTADDLVDDLGYEPFYTYMVIDPFAEGAGENPARFVALTEKDAVEWIATNGHTYIDDSAVYEHTGDRWRLKESIAEPWTEFADPRFVPPVVINPYTGADYDTLLSMLDGWVVRVHLDIPDGRENVGKVTHCANDNRIHLADDNGQIDRAIPLDKVRWIQVL